jgi:anti-anti-sigma regulatory factor
MREETAAATTGGWLTVVLRPAGTLDRAASTALGRSLADASTTADMVVVDLSAARVGDLAAFLGALRLPAARLARPGHCLLLTGITRAVEQAVEAAGVAAATLPADALPAPA